MLGAINSFASLITPLRYVSIPAQACEIVVEVGMANGLSGKIGFEVALGDVGAHFGGRDLATVSYQLSDPLKYGSTSMMPPRYSKSRC